MHSSCRIFPLSVVLCCAAGACSSSSAPADSASGGVSGGAPSSGASSVVSPGGGTGGAPGSTSVVSPGGGTGGAPGSTSVVSPGGGTGGAPGSTGSTATGGEGTTVTSGSSGGAITPGTGGSDLGAGTGGVTRGGPQSSGGSTVTGGGGATSAGGSAGKPDQSGLPAITVHLAGDSTMSTYAATTTQEGWGQELGQFFISKVTIDNQGQPGANIDSFYGGRWKTLINNVKAGRLRAGGVRDQRQRDDSRTGRSGGLPDADGHHGGRGRGQEGDLHPDDVVPSASLGRRQGDQHAACSRTVTRPLRWE
jgi:hypothetical protein